MISSGVKPAGLGWRGIGDEIDARHQRVVALAVLGVGGGAEVAAIVRPWNEPLKAMIAGRPVYAFARSSIGASAPPLLKKVVDSSPGARLGDPLRP